MADNLRLNANRPGTGRLGPLTPSAAPEQPAEAQPSAGASVVKKAKTDTLRLSTEAAGATGPLDPTKLNDMAKAVGAVQNERQQVSDFQARINAMVPGGVRFETKDGASWTSGEMKNLLEVVEGMSPGDRQALSGLNFVRAGQIDTAGGGDAAVGKAFGKELGDVAGESAMASAKLDGAEPKGFMAQVRNFALQSAEVLEGIPVLRFIGKTLKAMFGQEAPERAIVLGNSGSLVSKSLWAHEIGHQVQMVNRGWNPEKIAEFGKLSNWTENYGDGKAFAADGVDNRTGEKMLFDEQVLKAGRTDNFVSKYAMTNPTEDFAESYQAFLTDPKKLMELAPEKFLYINAQSQRYGASEVKGLAQQTGQDLEAVATELMLNSGLKQETLNGILVVNGLSPDKGALVSEAASQLASGDPLSQAWAKIAVEAKDPASASRLISNPEAALGDVWGKLSGDEQALFKDAGFMQARVSELQGGTASFRSSANAATNEILSHRPRPTYEAIDPGRWFPGWTRQDPSKALQGSGLNERLPEAVVQAFAQNPAAVGKMVSEIEMLLKDGGTAERYAANLAKALPLVGAEHFSAFAMALNNQKDQGFAAKLVRQALESGSVVYQGGGDPPMAQFGGYLLSLTSRQVLDKVLSYVESQTRVGTLHDLQRAVLLKGGRLLDRDGHWPILDFPLAVHRALQGESEVGVAVAGACALFYGFADITDEAQDHELAAEIWAAWGWEQAVNVGSALLFQSLKCIYDLCPADVSARVVQLFAQAGFEMTQGQHLDLMGQGRHVRGHSPLKGYLQTVEYKSGASFGLYAEAMALACGAATHADFHSFGRTLGCMFQMMSDVYELWGTHLSADFSNRRLSFPIALALEQMRGEDEKCLMDVLDGPISLEHQVRLRGMLEEAGIRSYATMRIEVYRRQAREQARQLGLGNETYLAQLMDLPAFPQAEIAI